MSVQSALLEIRNLSERYRQAGEIQNGEARQIGHRPRVAPLAYLNKFFAPASDAQIASIAQSTGRQPHQDFRSLLSIHNGLNLYGGSLSIFGVRDNYDREVATAIWLPFDLGPENQISSPLVGRDDMVIGAIGYADRVVLTHAGQVHRCDRYLNEKFETWSNLEIYLLEEVTRFDSCYGSDCYLRPDLEHPDGKAKPWDDPEPAKEIQTKTQSRLRRWLGLG